MPSSPPTPDDLHHLRTFQLYCYTCSGNTTDTLYGLIWLLVATNVELTLRLRQSEPWEQEVLDLRSKVVSLEGVVRRLQQRVITAEHKARL